jgi:hypothetical protein
MIEVLEKIFTAPAFYGFASFLIGLLVKNNADKAKHKETKSLLSDMDKKQNEAISEVQKKIDVLSDEQKEAQFSVKFRTSVTSNTTNYIDDYKGLDSQVADFLRDGCEISINIFKTILDSGFENYSRQIVENKFMRGKRSLASRYHTKNLACYSTRVKAMIEGELNDLLHRLDTVIKEKKNGVRRAAFEKTCTNFLYSIIKNTAKLNA